MQLLTFRRDQEWLLAVARGADVVEVEGVRIPGCSPMRAVLIGGDPALDQVRDEADRKFASGESVIPLAGLKLGPPIPDPDKILCVGFNYRAHTAEMETETPIAPNVFAKFRNGLIASGDKVVLPRQSSQIDYEGELSAVIGRRCRDAAIDDALEYVAGYTVLNDVTARDLQFRTTQWTLGKAIDTFCPMGPVLTLCDEIRDPQALELVTRLNGEVVQQSHCSEMVFSVAETIVALSSLMTLEPGDVISTGTPSGVGWKREPPRFLTAGDVLEVEIVGIGILKNQVVDGDDDRGPEIRIDNVESTEGVTPR